MKNNQQKKMHLQEHQRKSGGGPPASTPELITHSGPFYQKYCRPAQKNVRNLAIL